jgi:hypothetical protein
MNDHTNQPPPLDPPLPADLTLKNLFEALLRRPRDLVLRLGDGGGGALWRFLAIAAVSLAVFGFVLGCFAKHEQLWAAPLKITLGLGIAGLICLPSLYIFATLAGARMTLGQLAACLGGALALAGLLLTGFAPAIWIFAESTNSLGFMGALAIAAWLVAIGFGIRFLRSALTATGGAQRTPLLVWSGVFLLVTLQMTTSLRPILGRSPRLLTQEKLFFLQHWAQSAGQFLPPEKPATARDESANSPAN